MAHTRYTPTCQNRYTSGEGYSDPAHLLRVLLPPPGRYDLVPTGAHGAEDGGARPTRALSGRMFGDRFGFRSMRGLEGVRECESCGTSPGPPPVF